MTKEMKTYCPDCKKDTTHAVKEVTHKAKKLNFDQFDISLQDQSETGKIIRKIVEDQHLAVLECHICNVKQTIECHIKKKKHK